MNKEQQNQIVHFSFRERLQFYLIDSKTLFGKLIDIFIIFLNLIICAIFIIESYEISESFRSQLWVIEVVIVFFFLVEYVARLYAADKRIAQILDLYSFIDLIAILPTLSMLLLPFLGVSINLNSIKILRSIRVFRIFRFLRFATDVDFFFGKIKIQYLRVLRLFLTILIIMFISSGLFYEIESQLNPNVRNFGDAFYFSVVSSTTVGYGDITPVTEGGKWVTVIMILSGIILIPWQVSRMIREWIQISTKTKISCTQCGLRFHDKDASHCKYCGNIIYQEYDGT